jgi:hypothetical protein
MGKFGFYTLVAGLVIPDYRVLEQVKFAGVQIYLHCIFDIQSKQWRRDCYERPCQREPERIGMYAEVSWLLSLPSC